MGGAPTTSLLSLEEVKVGACRRILDTNRSVWANDVLWVKDGCGWFGQIIHVMMVIARWLQSRAKKVFLHSGWGVGVGCERTYFIAERGKFLLEDLFSSGKILRLVE